MLEGCCAWSVVPRREQLNSASGAGETPWATPVVGLIAGEERRRESRERLVELGEAAQNVEMWQKNPAKAASMVTGDVAMALVPGGAEAKGVLTVARSGQAMSVVGKAGKVSQKFGVPKAGVGASVEACAREHK